MPVGAENLCLRTQQIDEALLEMELELDWLLALSPTNNSKRWEAFRASGYRKASALTYPELSIDFDELRDRLYTLPMREIEHHLIESLLREKARELERQVDLLALRDQEGFIAASIACFGAPRPALLGLARRILDTVPRDVEAENDATAEDVLAEAVRARKHYREAAPDFNFEIHLVDDLNSMLMVNHGHLYIDRTIRLPSERVEALIAHELGTHVLTRYNGRHQPLHQLESGLAHYDALQEGLAALSEFLVGALPADRLRILAARVLAADMAIHDQELEDIFSALHEEYDIEAEDAFDTAVRAKRGGGLTKDACYLEGLDDLLSYLEQGGDVEVLFMGKFALSHVAIMEKLRNEGLLRDPVLLPDHITSPACRNRLEIARNTPTSSLFQRSQSHEVDIHYQ